MQKIRKKPEEHKLNFVFKVLAFRYENRVSLEVAVNQVGKESSEDKLSLEEVKNILHMLV